MTEFTEAEIGEDQFGFRKDRCCSDEISVVREMYEKMEKKRGACLVFMYLDKAYDRMEREAWQLVEIYGIGGKVLVAQSLYEQMSACVRVDGNVNSCFSVDNGVRQGFAQYLDERSGKRGCKTAQRR